MNTQQKRNFEPKLDGSDPDVYLFNSIWVSETTTDIKRKKKKIKVSLIYLSVLSNQGQASPPWSTTMVLSLFWKHLGKIQ